jgi:hypothetical protein
MMPFRGKMKPYITSIDGKLVARYYVSCPESEIYWSLDINKPVDARQELTNYCGEKGIDMELVRKPEFDAAVEKLESFINRAIKNHKEGFVSFYISKSVFYNDPY